MKRLTLAFIALTIPLQIGWGSGGVSGVQSGVTPQNRLTQVLGALTSNVSNNGTAETTLFSKSLLANQLSVNNDQLNLACKINSNGNGTERLRVYLSAIKIYDGSDSQFVGSEFLNVTVIRVSATSQRVLGSIGVWDTDNVIFLMQTILVNDTIATLTNTLDFIVTGQTDGGVGDLTANICSLTFTPSYSTN